jgi:steroid delta-isomerase-like uncharacterized protein
MSPEDNKAITRRWVDYWNERNMDAFYAAFAPDCSFPSLIAYNLPTTLEGYQQLMNTYLTAFPDEQTTIDEQIADGDKVMHRVTAHATHRGTFRGIPATNKQMTFTAFVIFRLDDGKIIEWRYYPDLLSILRQLGVVSL